MATTQTNLFYTREEVASLLRVDPQTIRRWTREAKIPAPVRLGRQLLWRRDALDRFLARLEEPARA